MALTDFTHNVLGFRDNNGAIGKVSFWIGLDSGIGTINDMQTVYNNMVTALQACTNAKLVSASGLNVTPPDPSQYGTAAPYANAEQKARLSFLAQSRLRSMIIQIPAPLLAIFFSGGSGTGGDEETVNPAATPIVNLLSAMTTISNGAQVTVGPFADPVHSLVVGKLRRAKNQRKIGKWSKDPTGTIPA